MYRFALRVVPIATSLPILKRDPTGKIIWMDYAMKWRIMPIFPCALTPFISEAGPLPF
jgi:hypothetical protein